MRVAVAAWLVAGAAAVLGLPAAAGGADASWNFAQAKVPAAQPLGLDGKGVLVAVVDTWVDYRDTEFGGRVVDEVDCLGSGGAASGCRDRTYTPDNCTHGTHVSGTVASADYGVAPDASIVAVQVLSYDPSSGECSGSTADVAAGIEWAAPHGARVINLSLGDLVPLFFQDSGITAAISAAASAGVVVVVAAGNSSVPFTDNYGSDALMVAATGPSGQLASYSNSFALPAGAVGMAAPGGDSGQAACDTADCVLSTLPGNSTGLLEGTSMATPHVSGTAALLLARDPSLTRQQVIEALTSTASPLPGAGSGLLDTAAAVQSVPQTAPSVQGASPSPSVATTATPAPHSSPSVPPPGLVQRSTSSGGGNLPPAGSTGPDSNTPGANTPGTSPPGTGAPPGFPVAGTTNSPPAAQAGSSPTTSRPEPPVVGSTALRATPTDPRRARRSVGAVGAAGASLFALAAGALALASRKRRRGSRPLPDR